MSETGSTNSNDLSFSIYDTNLKRYRILNSMSALLLGTLITRPITRVPRCFFMMVLSRLTTPIFNNTLISEWSMRSNRAIHGAIREVEKDWAIPKSGQCGSIRQKR